MNIKKDLDLANKNIIIVTKQNKNLRVELEKSDRDVANAISNRNSLYALSGVISFSPKENTEKCATKEDLMIDRQAVFQEMRKIPDVWIMPNGVATLAGVDEKITAAILRRAAKLDGVPIDHNGRRGLASKYRWAAFKN